MPQSVISVEGIGKKYWISHEDAVDSNSLRHILGNGIRSFRERLSSYIWGSKPTENVSDAAIEEFWALRDISIEIKRGERLGIIGRNGAGKSTLLKILSRITEPTEGRIRIRGRVASLLEVGTGFHPDLTGRENIFLNGVILGMSNAEVKRKFDEIVAFAEIGRFLDTPVKRYSSGMQVRLAFAVAAHLEPEILIVDEVLAVGDAQFQKKCLGKMGDIAQEGRTVLFVSHNVNAIEQLCSSALLLERGRIKSYSTDVRKVVKEYSLGGSTSIISSIWENHGTEFDNPWFKPLRFYLSDENGKLLEPPTRNDSEMWINVEGIVETLDPALSIGYTVSSEKGELFYWSCPTDLYKHGSSPYRAGYNKFKSKIPSHLFNEGNYRFELFGSLHFRKWIFAPGEFIPAIVLTIQGGLSESPFWTCVRPGLLAPVLEWCVEGECDK
ncbi:MAG: ABC transporter ATP-binding protein [Candidatus Riflebacteria bacterium]|nr:ABC transporter ATP-binding protein [Candidatus Riflebacteria bacterium]